MPASPVRRESHFGLAFGQKNEHQNGCRQGPDTTEVGIAVIMFSAGHLRDLSRSRDQRCKAHRLIVCGTYWPLVRVRIWSGESLNIGSAKRRVCCSVVQSIRRKLPRFAALIGKYCVAPDSAAAFAFSRKVRIKRLYRTLSPSLKIYDRRTVNVPKTRFGRIARMSRIISSIGDIPVIRG